ncbi:MAG: NAD(P)-dependent oxidoreductase [Propioniciclava sp.]
MVHPARHVLAQDSIIQRIPRNRATEHLTWESRPYVPGDLAGAWYAVADTPSPAVNAAVVAEATQQRIFCVRSDDAPAGLAWTPATGTHRGVTVATIARRDPRCSKELRDRILGLLAAEDPPDRT